MRHTANAATAATSAPPAQAAPSSPCFRLRISSSGDRCARRVLVMSVGASAGGGGRSAEPRGLDGLVAAARLCGAELLRGFARGFFPAPLFGFDRGPAAAP